MIRYISRAPRALAMTIPKNPLLVVLGATGTGKSQLAVDLAKRFNGEIINGDAVQMYDGLPIVTNKVTIEEQQGIPHHLLGFVALDEEPWRVSLFKKKASQIIKEIRSRGRLPIVVGGTHYYTQSLLFGNSIIAGQSDDEGNSTQEYTCQEISEKFPILDSPTEDLIERLREVDPVMAGRWHPKDRRKIRRSLEIFLMMGKKASEIYAQQKERKMPPGEDHDETEEHWGSAMDTSSPLLFWVHSESETLKKRLDNRVVKMVRAGLLEEVKAMNTFLQDKAKAGMAVDRTRGIWVSIGYKEFEPYLKALESAGASEEELSTLFDLSVEQTQAATRQYAKRQVRWIRLKLIPALKDEHALDKLYLFDGSDITRWEDTVSIPALEVAAKFLNGDELQPPQEVCSAAKEILSPEDALAEKPDVWFRQVCPICNITAVTHVQWQTHLKSRRHRGLVKKKEKQAASRGPCHDKNEGTSASETP